MKKFALALCAAAAALIASNVALAQSDTAGESRAAPSKPATKAEKKDAQAQRRATGKSVAKSDEGRLDDKAMPEAKKKATAEEKAAGKAHRKAAGTQAAKEGSSRLEEGEGAPVKK